MVFEGRSVAGEGMIPPPTSDFWSAEIGTETGDGIIGDGIIGYRMGIIGYGMGIIGDGTGIIGDGM